MAAERTTAVDALPQFWARVCADEELGDRITMRRLLLRDPCSYCAGPSATVDHIAPKLRGRAGQGTPGGRDGQNLAGCCSPCNQAKDDQDLLSFLLFGARERQPTPGREARKLFNGGLYADPAAQHDLYETRVLPNDPCVLCAGPAQTATCSGASPGALAGGGACERCAAGLARLGLLGALTARHATTPVHGVTRRLGDRRTRRCRGAVAPQALPAATAST
jgi:hypothetical protein